VIVKYYGLIYDKKKDLSAPRTDFISNGLFRITQPIFLNDKGSEVKLFPYFNEFSPADIEWAKKKFKSQPNNSGQITDEMLERYYLMPTGIRYGEAFPHMLKGQTNFDNINDYDREQFENLVTHFNEFLLQALSCKIGVLSLAKSDTNEHMWTHYASEGKGIAVTFNKKHEFFKKNLHMDVSYKPEDRATFTYYKGSIRINGELAKNFQIKPKESPILSMLHSGIDFNDLSNRLLFTKADNWQLEDETRIVFDLSQRDQSDGDNFIPIVDEKAKEIFPALFTDTPEICLKKIPFDAFESIVLGFCIEPSVEKMIITEVKRNNQLSHIKFKRVKHNIFGKLETEDVVV
jgi:hypothetical protein